MNLQRELGDAEDRLKRLYRSIEDGIVELDDILRERAATLKVQRERAKAALDHARAQCGTAATIDAKKIDAFARLMNDKLDNADTNARKGYIRSIIDAVEVDDRAIRIVGSKDVLQAAIAGKHGNVRGFVRKWRTISAPFGIKLLTQIGIDASVLAVHLQRRTWWDFRLSSRVHPAESGAIRASSLDR